MKKSKDVVKENEEEKPLIWVPLDIPDSKEILNDDNKAPPISSGIEELDNAFRKAFKKKPNQN